MKPLATKTIQFNQLTHHAENKSCILVPGHRGVDVVEHDWSSEAFDRGEGRLHDLQNTTQNHRSGFVAGERRRRQQRHGGGGSSFGRPAALRRGSIASRRSHSLLGLRPHRDPANLRPHRQVRRGRHPGAPGGVRPKLQSTRRPLDAFCGRQSLLSDRERRRRRPPPRAARQVLQLAVPPLHPHAPRRRRPRRQNLRGPPCRGLKFNRALPTQLKWEGPG